MPKVTTLPCIKGILFVLVLGCFLSPAQDKKIMPACGAQHTSGVGGTPVERLINPEGWTVPGLEGSHSVGNKVADTESEPGMTVYSTRLTPGKYTPTQLTYYRTTSDSKVLVAQPSQYVQVIQTIRQYEVNGHIFAYILETDTSAGCRPNSRRGNGAALICSGFLLCGPTYLKYYDNEGDGKFRTFEMSTGLGMAFPSGLSEKERTEYMQEHRFLKVPDWVKQSSHAQAAPPKSR